jgi:outer membrane lipoprotein-sorting protein
MLAPLAPLLLAWSVAAAAPDDGARAKELVEGAAAAMKEAAAVSCDVDVRLGMGGMEIAQRAKLLLQRPNRARLELAGAGQDAVIVLDGTTAWHYIKTSKRYVQSKQLGTMKLEQYGAGPAATLFFEKGIGALAPYLADAVVSQETIGEERCDVVSWKVGTEEFRLGFAANRLRRFSATRSLNGQRVEQTFDYGPFNLAPKVEEGAFVFTPPKGARPLDPDDESDLVEVGAELPDFTAKALDGVPLTRSAFKGKPLLLTFWFYG